ncbi:hypothetical protein B0H11DRAFT_1310926 [Mycena galericulata]|nr:hypothetical protein B0H11DRAFT_1310926 [Mycena galericulata]
MKPRQLRARIFELRCIGVFLWVALRCSARRSPAGMQVSAFHSSRREAEMSPGILRLQKGHTSRANTRRLSTRIRRRTHSQADGTRRPTRL